MTVNQASGDPEPVEALHAQLEGSLRADLDAQWDQVLDTWDDGVASQKKAVRAYASGLRNRILQCLLEIDTIDELERGVAIQYLEVKCHWTMLNARIQNQTAIHGRADNDLLYRATCVSLILEGLEPLLTQERIDQLTAVLAEPLGT